MIRLNRELNPELNQIELGVVTLSYSKHSFERAAEKLIRLPKTIRIGVGTVVETEQTNFGVSKLVVRISYDTRNDLVLVLMPKSAKQLESGVLFVKTVWLNRINDNHSSLNLDRLDKSA